MTSEIIIRGARLHNLKNINLSIPKNQVVVLTGISGSGKSTIGFDILFKESQRQFMEALGLVSFGLSKPPVDSITGLSPSVSIDQHMTNHSPRSTVGTSTDVYTYLRVLYARLGHRPCPTCGKDIAPGYSTSDPEWENEFHTDEDTKTSQETFPCPHCGSAVPEFSMANFSFNKPDGACPTCTGLGVVHQINIRQLVNDQKSVPDGAVTGWDANYLEYNSNTLQAAARYYGFDFDLSLPIKDYTQIQRDLIFYGVENELFRRHFPNVEPPATVRQGRFEGITTTYLRRYAERIQDPAYREKMEEFLIIQTCPNCDGTRLRPESRAVTVHGQTIIELSRHSLSDLGKWLDDLPTVLQPEEMLIAASILSDLQDRIHRLVEVGAGYLTIERASPTLSAGESQRLRLASLLGSGLSGVLYIFDEPTIGLHPRDTHRLINLLRKLRDLDNTVLVIEHDLDVINSADYVIDFGPGAGKHGGQVVAAGTPAEIKSQTNSITGNYLSGRISIPIPVQRREPNHKILTIQGARQHNLQNITVSLPLGLLVAVTGVSGSGKSTLIFNILDKAIRQRFYGANENPGQHDSIEGLEYIEKIITIDQTHIGRIPRSNVATYSDVFTAIRTAFAATEDAKLHGLTSRHFSFNVAGGRCPRCEGTGVLVVKMHFLPDVEVRCPLCHGRRFTRETLAVHYHDYDISQVLEMTVEEALDLFKDVLNAYSRLKVLSDVGLGYLQLGQPATTLSGGEAQRVKLAKELGRRVTGRTLYLLDEPTTGLHLADTARLLGVLKRLVDAGNSVVVVEHNLELVKTADWVIDLGPEGGAAGGKLIAVGTPEQITQNPESYTGQYLKMIMF
ncbi:MAG: excinuclease ABC subunit A [Chloroflexi bacterium HGW-Chloroflexi-8]|nr:MAG: excinuclease ABC subunit A [Chloroflexi bacterium HGW-Chloroflexi-8]